MITLKKLALAAGLCALGTVTTPVAFAQTTDGYHTIQIFPLVVDSGSFTQRFTFRNPNSTTITIAPSYWPGDGAAQATGIGCPSFTIAANSDRTFTSLRAICGTMALGSNFGVLYTYEINSRNMPYAGYSRVANPQGNGFSVEAFSPQNFTSATSVVTGLRRMAAGPDNPAFQTNCFIGNLVDYHPLVTPVSTDVHLRLYDSLGVQIGAATSFPVTPGKLTRLLDVFGAVGAPSGNFDNARARFFEAGAGEPSIMAFCTVQDNTSFGADFRIAKQEDTSNVATSNSDDTIGPQDDIARRNTEESLDMRIALGTDAQGTTVRRPFQIAAGGQSANTHVMYFRHPDFVQCELIDPATGLRAAENYGLEMRMVADDGVTVVAGGNESEGFSQIYLGDKRTRNSGANTRYSIEVEWDGTNTAAVKPYRLHCQSGSGHTKGELLRVNESIDRF